MRISDWSSDVCSSDLEGRYHAFQCFRLGYITGKGDRSLDLLFQRGETRCIARQYRATVAACGETPGHSRARPGADPCNERKRPALDVRGRRRLRVEIGRAHV